MTIIIRDAASGDAEAACETMRRSITELCAADHRDDPRILAAWLANKQPEIFQAWQSRADQSYIVAVEADRIVAVGAVTDKGEITLNYVSPDHRFKGVSRAMLAALEKRALGHGNDRSTLTSTATARRFYLASGYVETGPAPDNFGRVTGFRMAKPLSSLPATRV